MATWRIAVGVGIVVVLAAVTGFVVMSSDGDEPQVSASPIAAAPSATPTPSVDPDPMPELHNTGEDFDRIIRSIEEFRKWMYRHPDPDLAGRIFHKDCACYGEARSRLGLLQDDGVRFESNPAIIHEVSVLSRDPDAVAIRLVDEGLPGRVVDGNGNFVEASDGWELQAYRVLIVRAEGRWLVQDIRPMALESSKAVSG